MEMYNTPHSLNDYLNHTFTCSCGRTHSAPIKFVSVRENALQDLPKTVELLGCKSLYLICDPMTYGIAGEKCMQILKDANIKASIITLQHLGFDEATVGELLINMPMDCDLVVAVGTGSINDMTRFFSYRTGRPFMTVATAAPMDGFASSIAAIHVNQLKTTFDAQAPSAIIGDTQILKNAPYSLIAAGLGDLLGKSTCLCDWKIANLIIGEEYCQNIVELDEDCVARTLKDAPKAKDRDPQVLGNIMEGLVLAGVCMSLNGNSRPASGCEHHMSHYWETILPQRGLRLASHGIQVGVGTVLILKAVQELLKTNIDFEAAREAARNYDPEAWKQEITAAYGPAAPGVIALEEKSKKNDTEGRLARIDALEANWDKVRSLLEALPDPAYVAGLLEDLNAPSRPDQINVDPALLKDTFLYCKEIRPRYTILQMLYDLNLLDPVATAVVESYK